MLIGCFKIGYGSNLLEGIDMGGNSSELWIVGRSFWQLEADCTWSWTWDFHGVFSSKLKAAGLCKDLHWFIVPVVVDQSIPEKPHVFPDFIIPNKTQAEPLRNKRRPKVVGDKKKAADSG